MVSHSYCVLASYIVKDANFGDESISMRCNFEIKTQVSIMWLQLFGLLNNQLPSYFML